MEYLVHDSLQALEELIAINLSIHREQDQHRLLDKILSAARKITAAEAGCVQILDRTKRYLVPEILQGPTLEGGNNAFKTIDLKADRRGKQVDVGAYAMFSGQVVNIANAYKYSGFDFEQLYSNDLKHNYKTISILVIPLTDFQGVSIGVLQLFNRRVDDDSEPEEFPANMESLVKAFSAQAAVVISNTRLLEENRQLIEQLDQANQILEIENKSLRDSIDRRIKADEIIGDSPALQQVFALMEKVVSSKATVFITGETGTGKELIAACLHRNSPCSSGQFIAQNCAALPEELLESELFGYHKGAFTGAVTNKKGLIECADKGTLFLDEIGDMPMKLQAKVLRVLQESEVRPLGSTQSVKVDVRIVAATHQDLPKLIKEGKFREDLYYRLNVFPIHLPPLRERRQDLPALINHFLQEFSETYKKDIKGIKPIVMDLLQAYALPGNIRELRNIIERAVLLADEQGIIDVHHLPAEINELQKITLLEQNISDATGGLKEIMHQLEARVIAQQLEKHQGNQTTTAATLGVSRRSLVEKLSRYQLRNMDQLSMN
ncbi:MAG: sigma-54-dependent Fis family transcriptional regulator [Oceanospirillaceae bacterium]|nr:sigma-54-dependent Fis family transcriptional regulator [Oceanospirillaceae bacterium]